MKFYQDFYSANGMTLAVIGKESLLDLEVREGKILRRLSPCSFWLQAAILIAILAAILSILAPFGVYFTPTARRFRA